MNSDIMEAYNASKPKAKASKPKAKASKHKAEKVPAKKIDVELVIEKKTRKPRSKKVESPEPADVDVAFEIPKRKRGRPAKLKVEASAMLEV